MPYGLHTLDPALSCLGLTLAIRLHQRKKLEEVQ